LFKSPWRTQARDNAKLNTLCQTTQQCSPGKKPLTVTKALTSDQCLPDKDCPPSSPNPHTNGLSSTNGTAKPFLLVLWIKGRFFQTNYNHWSTHWCFRIKCSIIFCKIEDYRFCVDLVFCFNNKEKKFLCTVFASIETHLLKFYRDFWNFCKATYNLFSLTKVIFLLLAQKRFIIF